jgi:hypothetical protein
VQKTAEGSDCQQHRQAAGAIAEGVALSASGAYLTNTSRLNTKAVSSKFGLDIYQTMDG